MKTNVFFSFNYAHLCRVKQVRHIPKMNGITSAGFRNSALWELAKNDEARIKQLIDDALENTSVTVVCITNGLADREWIDYELNASLERGNGLVGIHLNHIYDEMNPDDRLGSVPRQITDNGFRVYDYTNVTRLAHYIGEAERLAEQRERNKKSTFPMNWKPKNSFSLRGMLDGLALS